MCNQREASILYALRLREDNGSDLEKKVNSDNAYGIEKNVRKRQHEYECYDGQTELSQQFEKLIVQQMKRMKLHHDSKTDLEIERTSPTKSAEDMTDAIVDEIKILEGDSFPKFQSNNKGSSKISLSACNSSIGDDKLDSINMMDEDLTDCSSGNESDIDDDGHVTCTALSKSDYIKVLLKDRNMMIRALNAQNNRIKSLRNSYMTERDNYEQFIENFAKTYLYLSTLQNFVFQYVKIYDAQHAISPLSIKDSKSPTVDSCKLRVPMPRRMCDEESCNDKLKNSLNNFTSMLQDMNTGGITTRNKRVLSDDSQLSSDCSRLQKHKRQKLHNYLAHERLNELSVELKKYESELDKSDKDRRGVSGKNYTVNFDDFYKRMYTNLFAGDVDGRGTSLNKSAVVSVTELLNSSIPFKTAEKIFQKYGNNDALFAFYETESNRDKLLKESSALQLFQMSKCDKDKSGDTEVERLAEQQYSVGHCKVKDSLEYEKRFPDVC